jgi:addiction module RelE/StbE family toxin
MKYKVILSDSFKKDLQSISDYIAFTLCNKKAAAELVELTKSEIASLADFPNSCPLCSIPRLATKNIRKLIIKNFIVLYRSEIKKKEVQVIRMVYGRQNYVELI